MVSVIDIFSGAGGLTHGFVRQGFNVVAGIDNDPTCRYAYESNNNGAQFVEGKLEDITSQQIAQLYGDTQIKILIGCAPCQPFSTYSRRYDPDTFQGKWDLVRVFGERIAEIQPDVVSMENVPALLRSDVYQEFRKMLQHVGYYTTEIKNEIVYAPDYGVPQKRKRLVFLASRFGEIQLNPPTHFPDNEPYYPTVESVIGDLNPLQAGQVDEHDGLHRTRGLSPKNLRRIRQSIPGGTWEDWDTDLVAACHTRDTGKFYKAVYGRMESDQPAPTITTQAFSYGSGRFGHYDINQNRALSLREIAMLQTFPEDYDFVDPDNPDYSFERIGRQLGNAVPVALAQVIAASIERHLQEHGYRINEQQPT